MKSCSPRCSAEGSPALTWLFYQGNRSVDFKGEALMGVLVDDGHPFEASAIVGDVEKKVVAPYVVRIVGS